MRFDRILVVTFLTVLFAGTGCGKLFGDSAQSSITQDDGGFMCTRADHEDLLESFDTQCTLSTDCPSGGFCDQTNHCNFECDSVIPCAGTKVCNCFGQCVGAEQVDGGPQLDPACPKEMTAIQTATTPPARVCDHDDTCPHGTHCSGQTGRCAKECLNNAECVAHNNGKNLCDCFGRCIAAPGEGPRPTRRLPELVVNPPESHIPGTVDRSWMRQIEVSLVTPDRDLTHQTVVVDGGVTTPKLTTAIDITLSPGLEATCTADAEGAPDFTVPCTRISPAGGWTFGEAGETFRAKAPLWIQHSVGTGEGATTWYVRLTSADVTSSPITSEFNLSGQPLREAPAEWVAGWSPPTTGAGYSGLVTARPISQGLDGENTSQLRDIQFPVRVWATPDGLRIFDDSRALAAGGEIPVNPSAASRFVWLNLTPETSPLFPASVDGHVSATTALSSPYHHTTSGGLRGDVTLTIDMPAEIPMGSPPPPMSGPSYVLHYVLSPDASVNCSAMGSCPTPIPFNDLGLTFAYVGGGSGELSLYSEGAPSLLVEQAICGSTSPTADPGSFSTSLPRLSDAVAEFSGDLKCVNAVGADTEMGGAKLLQYSDKATRLGLSSVDHPSASDPLHRSNSSELLAKCLVDLGQTSMGAGDCLDIVRFKNAVDAARSNIQGSTTPQTQNEVTFTPGTGRLLHRLMQQWLQTHSFVASQGLEEWRLHQVLASASSSDTGGDAPPAASPIEILKIMENGWVYTVFSAIMKVSNYRIVPGFAGLPTAILREPDYRLDHPGATPDLLTSAAQKSRGYDHSAGLPVTLLETYSWHLRVLDAYLDEVSTRAYLASLGGGPNTVKASALERVGAAFAYGATIETLAGSLYQRAASPTLAWKDRWDIARNELAGVRSRVLAKARALAAGRNPLGIDEDDTPLFFGDAGGSNSKYFAASDYLVSTWATSAVATAQNTLGAARDAWMSARSAQIQDKMTAADQVRRIEQLQAQYGRTIIDNCGLTKFEAKDVLDAVIADESTPTAVAANPDKIYLSTCFINPDMAKACADVKSVVSPAVPIMGDMNADAFKAKLIEKFANREQDHMSFEMSDCIIKELGLQVSYPQPNPNLCTMLVKGQPHVRCGKIDQKNKPAMCGQMCQEVYKEHCTCIDGRVPSPNSTPYPTQCCYPAGTTLPPPPGPIVKILPIPDSIDYKLLTETFAICSDIAGSTVGEMPGTNISRDCFRGKIGELGMSNIGALQDVFVAKANFRTAQATYSLLAKNCLKTEEENGGAAGRADQLNNVLKKYSLTRYHADQAANALQGAASAVGGLSMNPFSWGGGALEAAATVARGISLSAQKSMDDARREYENFTTKLQFAKEIRNCWVDAERTKLQIDGAMLQTLRRQTDVNAGVVALSNLIRANEQSYYEGINAVKRERSRFVSTVAHHYWLNEKIDRFRGEFEWAKRLTYMAMRAVEYEFQQSFALREQILSATHPDQLETALRSLQQELATRSINRRRPDAESAVLSLRDDILGLTDRTGQPPGERNWSAAQRFRGRLWDSAYTLYDESGAWLGQGIPFTLVPEGILKNRCGERLDRVSATVQGDGLDSTDPSAPLLLLKRNTFGSQWCSGHGDESSPLQMASVQPSRQLFRPGSQGVPSNQGQAFVSAFMTPYFNVRRADFFRSEYQQGSSDELAGRGLYGDYVLLFPKQLLEGSKSLAKDVGVVDESFPLDRVEDVLLRFDYLSVDNLPNISQ